MERPFTFLDLLDDVTDEYTNSRLASIVIFLPVYNTIADIIKKHNLKIDKKFGLPEFNIIRIEDNDAFEMFDKYKDELEQEVKKHSDENDVVEYSVEMTPKEIDYKSYVIIKINVKKKSK